MALSSTTCIRAVDVSISNSKLPTKEHLAVKWKYSALLQLQLFPRIALSLVSCVTSADPLNCLIVTARLHNTACVGKFPSMLEESVWCIASACHSWLEVAPGLRPNRVTKVCFLTQQNQFADLLDLSL